MTSSTWETSQLDKLTWHLALLPLFKSLDKLWLVKLTSQVILHTHHITVSVNMTELFAIVSISESIHVQFVYKYKLSWHVSSWTYVHTYAPTNTRALFKLGLSIVCETYTCVPSPIWVTSHIKMQSQSWGCRSDVRYMCVSPPLNESCNIYINIYRKYSWGYRSHVRHIYVSPPLYESCRVYRCNRK